MFYQLIQDLHFNADSYAVRLTVVLLTRISVVSIFKEVYQFDISPCFCEINSSRLVIILCRLFLIEVKF